MPNPRPLTTSITVRLTADEAAQLRQLAQANRLPYAEVIRNALAAYARPRGATYGPLPVGPCTSPFIATITTA